jgi:membrane-associated phospholipid phosphatase
MVTQVSRPAITLPTWVDDVDERIDELWETLRGIPTLDRIFYAASAAGDFSAIWHAYNITRAVTTSDGKDRFSRFATALAVESLLVNQVIKRGFERHRPDEPGDRPHHLRTPSTSSFPSGHASSAAMAASLLNQRGRHRVLTTAIAAVVATSRVHVRIHHASDVVVGALIGAAIGATWKRVWPLG